MAINSPRGTADIIGEDIKYRDFIINTARGLFDTFNYSEIITPAFEYTELFDRGIGENTDIVQKEMYTFRDKKGRSLTLRPEGTASVVRAVIENKIYSGDHPVKLFYIENMFRYERPQKGRMREFWQLGVEAAGSGSPGIDTEVIWLLNMFFQELGFKNLKLIINNVGCTKCRKDYIDAFKKYLKPQLQSLCPDCRVRYERNPLRIFDCKTETCKDLILNSPKVYDHICTKCRTHFEEVLNLLSKIKIDYLLKKDLVRGFDYYTGTIFEIISEDLLSTQNALGGGGRYDGLFEEFGGPSIPSIGFAVGIDRSIMLMKELDLKYRTKNNKNRIYIITMDEKHQEYAFLLLNFLRNSGYCCDIKYNKKNIGSNLKWAEKNDFTHAVIIGEEEASTDIITIKDLKKFDQYKINWKKEPDKVLDLFEREK